jgi:peptidylprolyl isomerase
MKTTLSVPSLIAVLSVAALPIAAQTSTTTKPPVHHTTTTTTAHRPATTAAGHCSVTLPALSAKIPALPAAASKCASVGYQLTWIDTKIGEGELAAPKKWYTVHYTGYLLDGTKFDSSVDRNEPITFPYGAHRVITGWDTGFEGMHVGGKRRLFVPYQLAYGEAGRPPVIPEKAELVFDVELVSQSDNPPAPKTPPAPPAGAQPATPPAGTPPAGANGAAVAPKPSAPVSSPATAPAGNPAPTPAGATTTTPSGTTPAPKQ